MGDLRFQPEDRALNLLMAEDFPCVRSLPSDTSLADCPRITHHINDG